MKVFSHLLPLSTVLVLCLSSKDVRLPREMQRAMAAEAEATREASAKVCTVSKESLKFQLLKS